MPTHEHGRGARAVVGAWQAAPELPHARAFVLAAIGILGLWAFVELGLTPAVMLPRGEDLRVLARFLSHALHPALSYEGAYVPADAPPLLAKALDGARRTVMFAAASMSIALVIGAVFGFLGSTAWWAGDSKGEAGSIGRVVGPAVYAVTRITMTLLRSIHELLWAVLFLSAFGLSGTSAALAIAIPYGGTLAKVFSEMIDEAPRDAADALRGAGARPSQIYLFGLVVRALPDIAAYTFYRFECAVRSSAILGFFGPETLGKFIRQSWNESYYGEVWTYLYVLFALVAFMDWWSGALRRRFAA